MTTTPLHPSKISARTSETMSRIASRATKPEILFRKALRRVGVRSFQVCDESLPGRPDLVMPGKRLAIFIDGDFWHGHQYKIRGHDSLESQLAGINNAEYWSSKIFNNILRDFKNTAALLESGWQVLRFWESDLQHNLARCVQTTLAALSSKPTISKAAFNELSRRTAVELFAGIGLVRLALKAHDWEVVFANDNDPQKYEMYAPNFAVQDFDQRSIKDIPASDVPAAALITASFPCNDLSIAGSRNGLNGNHSGTFWELVRLLKDLGRRRPPLVLLENVLGFLTSHNGRDFETALSALNKLGYSCDAFIVNAARFVPQSRARLFVVAKQEEPSESSVVHLSESTIRPKQLVTFMREHKNIAWNVRRLPELPNLSCKLQDILEDLPDHDPHWWSTERAQYFLNQLSPKHRKIADMMMCGEEFSYATAFRRIRHGRSMAEIRVDGIAGCLRTPRGGSARQILFKAGRGECWVRLLTARECARLQGVPDTDFHISVPLNQALFGFGDAVCVPVIRWIIQHYLVPTASELMRGRLLKPITNR